MTCTLCSQQMSAYIDRELSATESWGIRDHLKSCLPCHAEFESIRRTKKMLGCLHTVEMPDGLEEKMLAGVRSGISFSPIPMRFRSRAYLATAFVATVLAFEAFSLSHSLRQPAIPDPSPSALATDESTFASGDIMAGGVPTSQASFAGR